MKHIRILPATLAAILALGTSGAAFAGVGEKENSKEIAAVVGARTSAAEAIATAERHTGGLAVKIGLEKNAAAYLYGVKTISNDTVAEVFVDPASGAVVRSEGEGLITKFFDDDRADFATLAASTTTLATAIATAEKTVGGKAVEAVADNEDDTVVFEVEVARDHDMFKVVVDSVDGKVVKFVRRAAGEHAED